MRRCRTGLFLAACLFVVSCRQDATPPPAAPAKNDKSAAKSNVVVLTEDNFDQEVLKSTKPVLVDFWAPWCGPCRLISPIVENLSVTHGEQVKVAKFNYGPQGEGHPIAVRQGVRSLPTLVLFRDGKEVERFEGVPRDNAELVVTVWLEDALAAK